MRWLIALSVPFLVAYIGTSALAAPPPPSGNQPHPDQFIVEPYGNLAQYNPLEKKVAATRTVTYSLVTMPGCTTGIIPQAMTRVEQEASAKLGVTMIRTLGASTPDFVVRINCGSEQIRICGAVNIFCLGRGFPYVLDVDLSDILNTYQDITQLAIPLHEIIGHAFATWDEQYCKGNEPSGNICRGLPLFGSAPNWIDIMNTGPDSRHALGQLELDRWSRTMYDLTPAVCPVVGYDPCVGRWRQTNGYSWDPATGIWWVQDTPEWLPCNSDKVRWSLTAGVFSPPGSGNYLPSRGYWSFAPDC